MVAATMGRGLLGPVREPGAPGPGRLADEIASVAAGLTEGARYVLRRRDATAVLGATGGNRLLYGALFLMSILLYRNYFYRSSVTTAEGHFTVLVTVTAVGYGCAALVTPPAVRRLTKAAWITLLLAASAVLTGVLGETFSPVAYLVMGFALGLSAQGVAICATTILQEEVDDAYRGRVFAFYDMTFNVTYAGGAALGTLFMPPDGHSPVLIGIVAAGYAVVAAGYWLGRGQSSPAPGSDGTIPSAAAQRSSS
jgi:MFS family permease